ncbi:MAG: arginase family protein, partial [Nitrososphaera sp.]|nr:arginase family protein [Nitrososphaera sp.]
MDIFSLFTAPEKTKAGYSFADTPVKISFKESEVVFYGVPLEITTSFGRGTARGPEAMRVASARQIETFVLDEKADIYDLVGIFDLGDLKLPKTKSTNRILAFLDSAIPKVVDSLRTEGKIPVLMGGEHTLTFYQLKSLAREKPVVIHFDAHRDMKPDYDGMKICHTTPFYHLLEFVPGENIIQIGIRQTGSQENETAVKNGVTTFDAWQVQDN